MWTFEDANTKLTNEELMELEAQRKDKEAQGRSNWRIKETEGTVQCFHVIHGRKRRATTQTPLVVSSRGHIELNPARNQNPCHQHQVWVTLQLALQLLVLMTLQLYHLPPPFSPPISNSSCLFTWCQPLDASCCIVPLYFSRYCTVKLNIFSLFLCFLCTIYVKSITLHKKKYFVVLYSWLC